MTDSLDTATIVDALGKKFKDTVVMIRNLSDNHLGYNRGIIHQYVFGVTPCDPYTNSFEHYRHQIEGLFGKTRPELDVWGWRFQDYDRDRAAEVITELAAHFEIAINAEELLERAGVVKNRPEGNLFYLVVTINRIEFFTPER